MCNYELEKAQKLAVLQTKMIDIFGEQLHAELLNSEGLVIQDKILLELNSFIYHNFNWNPVIVSEMDFDWSEDFAKKFIWAAQILGEYNQITNQSLSWEKMFEGK